ncbi:glucose 1-dehydrogenase [Nostoc sp. CHAB 5784]|uniref:SDR family NAD(P)-dependent oxidoreductase n=1 Tax=Nostoc mirabile TaxID=2907820 RepID=UPI001E520780|nr:glucose 1-dehydrogenase [Nostoc mirabile]MCC5670377.1 glucose 1-dehydrogenase [Nostoc mirabile CHAB5784]
MVERLRGKRSIITGGANGIGKAIAEAFASEGADVFLTAQTDEAAAQNLCEHLSSFGVRTSYTLLNAQEPDAVSHLFAASHKLFGCADILVNNAATATRTAFVDFSLEEYNRTLEVNLRFPFLTTQYFARACIADSRQGSIINISSISATKAISKMSAYQCSKAGLLMLSKGAAYELASHGIRVNTISPGLTATKANSDQWLHNPSVWAERGKDIPLGRTGQPKDIAGAAIFLASEESSWITGANIVVDGGDSVI